MSWLNQSMSPCFTTMAFDWPDIRFGCLGSPAVQKTVPPHTCSWDLWDLWDWFMGLIVGLRGNEKKDHIPHGTLENPCKRRFIGGNSSVNSGFSIKPYFAGRDTPLVIQSHYRTLIKIAHLWTIFTVYICLPLNMVIFHRYVNLQEGSYSSFNILTSGD